MITALDRLRRQIAPPLTSGQLAAFGITGGFGRGLRQLFMTHPPLEERIAALQEHQMHLASTRTAAPSS